VIVGNPQTKAEVEAQFAAHERALISSAWSRSIDSSLGAMPRRCRQLKKRQIVNSGRDCASAATLFGSDSTQSKI
jgi:hypothetical protein